MSRIPGPAGRRRRLNERLSDFFRLNEAADHLPTSYGRKFSLPTIHRWASSGCRGVRLETVMIGGTRYTSEDMLERFVAAVTAKCGGTIMRPPSRRTAAVSRELD